MSSSTSSSSNSSSDSQPFEFNCTDEAANVVSSRSYYADHPMYRTRNVALTCLVSFPKRSSSSSSRSSSSLVDEASEKETQEQVQQPVVFGTSPSSLESDSSSSSSSSSSSNDCSSCIDCDTSVSSTDSSSCVDDNLSSTTTTTTYMCSFCLESFPRLSACKVYGDLFSYKVCPRCYESHEVSRIRNMDCMELDTKLVDQAQDLCTLESQLAKYVARFPNFLPRTGSPSSSS